MPQMTAAPTFQLPQLQAFSGGAQTTEAVANLANQLLQAWMQKKELDKGDARSAELRDLLVSAGQPYMENVANITPEELEGLAVGADLTQIPEEQRLSTGAVPVEQALGFRVEQGQTSDPLAEALLRPRLDPAQPYQRGDIVGYDSSVDAANLASLRDPADPGRLVSELHETAGTPIRLSSAAPQYGEAPFIPPEQTPGPMIPPQRRTTEQIQKDLRVIPEIDTAALPQFYTTAEGEKISVDDPNIDRPYIARDITPRQALMEALQGTDTKFRKSDFGPLEQVLFEDIMKAAPGQSKILSGKNLPSGFNEDAVVQQFTNSDGQLEWKVLQAGTAPKTKKYVEYWDADGQSTLVVEGSQEQKSLVERGGVTSKAPANDLQIIRAMHMAGVPEGSPEWKKNLDNFIENSAKGAGDTIIKNFQDQDNAFGVALAKGQAEQLLDLEAAAGASQDLINQLKVMATIPLPNEGILSNFHHTVRKWADGVGMPMSAEAVTKIRNVEQFKAVFTNLLAAKLSTQTGSQTEDDARRMGDSLAQLTNMKDANEFIIDMSIAIETRKIEQARFWSRHAVQEGNVRGAAAAWEAHKEKTPLFTYNYKSGAHMFYPQWKDIMRADNAGAQNLEWDGKIYENNNDGLEKLWQDQHFKYMTTERK